MLGTTVVFVEERVCVTICRCRESSVCVRALVLKLNLETTSSRAQARALSNPEWPPTR